MENKTKAFFLLLLLTEAGLECVCILFASLPHAILSALLQLLLLLRICASEIGASYDFSGTLEES